MKKYLHDFWDDSIYFANPTPVTEELIGEAQRKLGFKFPNAYIELIKTRNGGIPINTNYPTTTPTSWAKDHIAISNIRGIGGTSGIESDSERSNDEDWGYPVEIGFIVCDCPSAGHDAVMLDYSLCGKDGEPRVIHVDVEMDDEPYITVLADNFETFLNGLLPDEHFDD